MDKPDIDWLTEKATVEERPFPPSRSGLLGQLIVRVRTLWSQVATKWYVRPLVQQQNLYNHALIEQLRRQESRLTQLDHDQAELTHDMATLTSQLIQLNHLLSRIEQRLAQLEATQAE